MGAADPARGHPAEAGVMSRVAWSIVGRAKARSRAPRPPHRLFLAALAIFAGLGGVPATSAAQSDLIEQGRDLYADACAACHGRDMVNAGGIAFDLRKFPKDDFARFRNSVLNGKGEAMPAWRDKVDDNDLAALWAYVRNGG